jgi:hypothetical protein
MWQYGIISILMQLYLDSEAKNIPEGFSGIHLCHFLLDLIVAFQIQLINLKDIKMICGWTHSINNTTDPSSS